MRLGNRDKFFALGAEIVRSLSRFALGIAIARWLGPDAYGTFVVMLTVEIIFHTFCSALWAAPMASLAPGLPEPQRSGLVRTAVTRQWRGSALSALGALALAPWLLGQGVSPWQILAFMASIVLCGGLNLERSRVACAFRSKAGIAADLWSTGLPVVAVAAAYFLDFDIALVYWASRAAGALASCIALRSSVPVPTASDDAPVALEEFERMGRHMAVGSVANSVCTRVQPFVLASFATSLQLGLFGAAVALTGPMRMATAALSGVLRPRLALHFGTGNDAKGWLTSWITLGAVYGLGLVALVGAWLLGPFVCELAFGPEYPGLATLLLFATLHAALASGNSLLVVVIQVVVNAAVTAKMRIAVGAITLATVGPCVLYGGAAGAFGSLIVAEAVYAAIGAVVLVRARRERASNQALSPVEPQVDSVDHDRSAA